MFTLLTSEDVREAMEGQTDWLIEGVISSGSTLIYGESEAGKSFIVSALLAALETGKPFLNYEVPQREFRPAVAFTDDNGHSEYCNRIESVLPTGQQTRTRFVQLPVMRDRGMWEELHRVLTEAGVNLLVVDNITQAADGDLNKAGPVRDFFEGIRLFVNDGIPVIVVGHSSEKSGPNGGKSDNPMGSSAIKAAVRWRIFVKRAKSGVITLSLAGNSGTPHEIKLTQADGALFDVVDTADTQAVQERASATKQKRGADKLTRNREIADWVVDHCGSGLSYRAAGDLISDKFGGSGRSWGESLRSRDLSGLVTRLPNGTWERC